MKNYIISLFWLITTFLVFTSCNSNDSNNSQLEEQQTYLKATINGVEFIGKIDDFNTDDETYFYIESVSEDGKKIVELHCNFAPSIGSFEYPQLSNAIQFLYSDTTINGRNPTRVYQTGIYQDNLGEGSLTITELQTDIYNTILKGTLSFSAPCYGATCSDAGVVETSNITNGSFIVKLN